MRTYCFGFIWLWQPWVRHQIQAGVGAAACHTYIWPMCFTCPVGDTKIMGNHPEAVVNKCQLQNMTGQPEKRDQQRSWLEWYTENSYDSVSTQERSVSTRKKWNDKHRGLSLSHRRQIAPSILWHVQPDKSPVACFIANLKRFYCPPIEFFIFPPA